MRLFKLENTASVKIVSLLPKSNFKWVRFFKSENDVSVNIVLKLYKSK